MNTYARQSISKTLIKACAAAVLLVTCLNSQAADSIVNKHSENFRAETMASIQVELNNSDYAAPSLEIFNTAVDNAVTSFQLRAETLSSIKNDLQSSDLFAPSLDTLSVALENTTNEPRSDVLQAEQSDTNWTTTTKIYPSIASLGNIDFEIKDATSREATMIALDFAIEALESATSNLSVSQRLTL